MPYVEDEPGQPRLRDAWRRDRYAGVAGERLRARRECQFSLLPYHELMKTAAHWYEACTDAMLRGNYTGLDNWMREQARVAAEQGFELADLLELLRQCRQVAIEQEGWHEEQFSEVDAVIDDCLGALRTQVRWEIPAGLNYLTGKSRAAAPAAGSTTAAGAPAAAEAAPATSERRGHGRSPLRMPIRVRGEAPGVTIDEFNKTENVARGGICFLSRYPYFKGLKLVVTYPHSSAPGAINQDYPAEVVRVDEREGGRVGVAVKFLVSLGKKTR
ncbi:MAG: PilZ domain-containing protein [Acidobacteria bacterium]|nr:PilZ domain-containing protein [Acidobacteriota bacterium]